MRVGSSAPACMACVHACSARPSAVPPAPPPFVPQPRSCTFGREPPWGGRCNGALTFRPCPAHLSCLHPPPPPHTHTPPPPHTTTTPPHHPPPHPTPPTHTHPPTHVLQQATCAYSTARPWGGVLRSTSPAPSSPCSLTAAISWATLRQRAAPVSGLQGFCAGAVLGGQLTSPCFSCLLSQPMCRVPQTSNLPTGISKNRLVVIYEFPPPAERTCGCVLPLLLSQSTCWVPRT